jgi:hypothetical protein
MKLDRTPARLQDENTRERATVERLTSLPGEGVSEGSNGPTMHPSGFEGARVKTLALPCLLALLRALGLNVLALVLFLLTLRLRGVLLRFLVRHVPPEDATAGGTWYSVTVSYEVARNAASSSALKASSGICLSGHDQRRSACEQRYASRVHFVEFSWEQSQNELQALSIPPDACRLLTRLYVRPCARYTLTSLPILVH